MLNWRTHFLVIASMLCITEHYYLQAQSPTITSNTDSSDKATASILEFPIVGNSIDGKEFYETVLSNAHWTTKIGQAVSSELRTNRLNILDTNERISVDALKILVGFFPTAFEFVESPGSNSQPTALRVNMKELESKWSSQKLSVRNWLSTKSKRPLFEVCFQVGFDGRTEKTNLVMVLPGLHGGAESASKVAAAIHEKTGLASCVFRYPNDAPLAESTEYLSQVVKSLHQEFPKRRVTLVTHSMGSLVARNAVERNLRHDDRCSGIEQLIMICPPNEGSVFAEYAGVLEVAEQLQSLTNKISRRKAFTAILDGFNEAPADLVPNSQFLKNLAAAKRNPKVKYSILAGDAGLVDPLVADLGNDLLELLAKRVDKTKSLQERAGKLLNSAELRKGSGDGVVTLQSAKLEGVDDFEVLPVNHLQWCELEDAAGQRIISEVVERITSRSF
jgi:pimeloyl-ACP methyl ester carboxylesterase